MATLPYAAGSVERTFAELVVAGAGVAALAMLAVVALGVLWELIEFYISVGARLLGGQTILSQYGLDDTGLDVAYNTLGGVLVAVFGTAHLNGLADQVAARLVERRTDR